ncbi:MAG: Smr/MutS family protein [Alphaproteobacteria bacterium]
MKKLTDEDIENMIGDEFTPDNDVVRRGVRASLRLSMRIPEQTCGVQNYVKLDLHQLTEEQAWSEIMNLAQSGVRDATIITGASGILRIKFMQWVNESLLSPYINSVEAINNGSFRVKFNEIKVTF